MIPVMSAFFFVTRLPPANADLICAPRRGVSRDGERTNGVLPAANGSGFGGLDKGQLERGGVARWVSQ